MNRQIAPINHKLSSSEQSRGGSAKRMTYKYSIQDIAKAAGKSVAAVQKAKDRGLFDQDLLSLSTYVCIARKLIECPPFQKLP